MRISIKNSLRNSNLIRPANNRKNSEKLRGVHISDNNLPKNCEVKTVNTHHIFASFFNSTKIKDTELQFHLVLVNVTYSITNPTGL